MIILAEISDKMLTSSHNWALMIALASPFLLGSVRLWLAWVLLPIGALLSGVLIWGAYHEAFLDPVMSGLVQHEMGPVWITNSIASASLPLLVAACSLIWIMKKESNKVLEATSL